MMKLYTTEAIVLKRINYAEADRIITVLSDTHGKVSLVAKGARRLRSRLAGGIEQLCLNEMVISPGKKDLGILISSRMLKVYSQVLADFTKNQHAHGFMMWLYKYIEDGQGQEYFETLKSAFNLLEVTDGEIAFCYFYLKIFHTYGSSFELAMMANGKPLSPAKAYRFDGESLSFQADVKGTYSQSHIKLMRFLLSNDWQAAARLQLSETVVKDVAQLIRGHPVYLRTPV